MNCSTHRQHVEAACPECASAVTADMKAQLKRLGAKYIAANNAVDDARAALARDRSPLNSAIFADALATRDRLDREYRSLQDAIRRMEEVPHA